MSDLIIKGGTIVTVDKRRRIIKDGAIVIDGNKIEFMGKADDAKKFRPETVIDATKKVIFPGLVNSHDHMWQCLFRNLGTDVNLLTWLKTVIHPAMSVLRRSEDGIRAGARLACLENIKSGATYVIDNHYGGQYDAVIEAIIDSGMKGCLARGIYELNVPEALREDPKKAMSDCERLAKKWNGAAGGKIMVGVAPMHPCHVSKEMMVKAKEFSDKYKTIYHTHTAESREDVELCKKTHGLADVELMHELGCLSPRYMSVHSVQASERDIKYLAEAGCSVVHNPCSNMYLGSGIAPIPEMRKAGINVTVASDGPASNNNQDVIESMKFAALLHKVSKRDPAIITAWDVLEMATINGARALGLEREIGSLEVGKRADLMIVDMEKPHIAPVHDPVASLVYCANGSDVETLIVDGKIVMENRRVLTMDEAEVLRKANEISASVMKEAGITL